MCLKLFAGQVFPAFGKVKQQDGVVGESSCGSAGRHPGRKDKKCEDNKKNAAYCFKQRGDRKIFFHKSLADTHQRKKTVTGSEDAEKEPAHHI